MEAVYEVVPALQNPPATQSLASGVTIEIVLVPLAPLLVPVMPIATTPDRPSIDTDFLLALAFV